MLARPGTCAALLFATLSGAVEATALYSFRAVASRSISTASISQSNLTHQSVNGLSQVSIQDPVLGSALATTSVVSDLQVNSAAARIESLVHFDSSLSSTARVSVPSVMIYLDSTRVDARLRIEWERFGSGPNLQQIVEVDVENDGSLEISTGSAMASLDIPIQATPVPRTIEIAASVSMGIGGTGSHAVAGTLRVSLVPDGVAVSRLPTSVCAQAGDLIDIEPNFQGGLDIVSVHATANTVLLLGNRLLPSPLTITPSACPIEVNPVFAVVVGTRTLRIPGSPMLGTVYLQAADVRLSSSSIFPDRTYEARF